MSFCGRSMPYFRPRFWGEKARTLDSLVELVRPDEHTLYFFAQVKATQKERTKREGRLRVEMSAEDVRRAARVPAPTYLIGVDEREEALYILPILFGMTEAISSIPTTFPLDGTNLPCLYTEVEQFWLSRDMTRRSSVFSTEGGGV